MARALERDKLLDFNVDTLEFFFVVTQPYWMDVQI